MITMRIKRIAAIVVGLTMMGAVCYAQGGGGAFGGGEMPKGVEKIIAMFTERLEHRFTPVITRVSVGNAVAGKPVSVTIQAAHDDDRTVDKVVEAAVYYSVDGGKLFIGPVKLAQSKSDAKTWSGAIPPISKSGQVIFYPWVKDSYGNVAVEIPCKVSAEDWPPAADGCMAFGAADGDPVDDPSGLIDDNYDVWSVGVGMDDQFFYLNQNVEGKIYKGNMQEQLITAYTALLIDTKKLYEVEDIMSFMSPGGGGGEGKKEEGKKGKGGKAAKPAERKAPDFAQFILYAPLAKIMGGNFGDCGVFRMEGKSPMIDGTNVKCEEKGTDLYVKIDRKLLKGDMRNSFTLIGAMTGYMQTGGGTPLPMFQDFTALTRVSMKPHSFVVK